MHPSSFYDLRARYIYTPLYGPYSLSEALEGLISYSLEESRDSISIGLKRTLRHELVSELRNVIDDLQDYLVYFSSKFLISPLNSLDFIKELQASHDEFKHLIVCWGAIVACLATARKIVERNFWPHLFQPTINDPAVLQKSRRLSSSVLPNATLDKLSAHASTLISPSHTVSAPYSTHGPLEVRCQSFNAQSPQPMPSKSNPTGDEEDCVSSLRLDTTPTSSVSLPSRISLNHQLSITSLNLDFSATCEARSDEASTQLNRTSAVQHTGSSTPAHASNAREPGKLKNNAKVVGSNGQPTKGIEVTVRGDEVTEVPCPRFHPVQLTPIQGKAARGFVPVSTRLPSLSMAPGPSSTSS